MNAKTTHNNTYLVASLTLLIGVFGFLYFFTGVFGGTQISVSLPEPADLETGLILHLTFEPENIDLASSTGEILDAGPLGAIGDWQNHASTTQPGYVGQAIEFDAVDDEIIFPYQSGFDTPSGYTFMAWVYHDADGSGPVEPSMLMRGTGSANGIVNIGRSSAGGDIVGGNVRMAVGHNNSSGLSYSGWLFPFQAWHHATVVWDGSNVRYYKNGEFVDSDPMTEVPSFLDQELRIGESRWFGTVDQFAGKMDDVRLYNYALATSTIERIYSRGAGSSIGEEGSSISQFDVGLVRHFTFDDVDLDLSSSTAEILERIGSTTANWTNHASSTVSGYVDQAISFNGIDQYVVAESPNLPTDDFTYTFWVYPRDDADNEIFMMASDGAGNNEMAIQYENGGVRIILNNISITSTIPVSANTWSHITYTRTAGEVLLYINGLLAQEDSSSVTLDFSTCPLLIATDADSGCTGTLGNYADAILDDIRIYNYALAPATIGQLYEDTASTTLPATSPTDVVVGLTLATNPDLENGLIAHWTLDGGDIDWDNTTAEIMDRGPNGYHGNATNLGVDSGVPGKIGQGLLFDGSGDYFSGGSDSAYDDMEQFSACAWHKRESPSPSLLRIFSKKGDASGVGWHIGINDIDHLQLIVKFGISDGHWRTSGSLSPQIGEWQHFCIAYDRGAGTASDPTFYINGESITVTETSSPDGAYASDAALTLYIGRESQPNQRHYGGVLDDLRIYNRILSASEVQRIYHLGR